MAFDVTSTKKKSVKALAFSAAALLFLFLFVTPELLKVSQGTLSAAWGFY